MAVVFLIGGTGNQLFEFASARPTDQFSMIFLQPWLRKRLGWTNHDQVLEFPSPSIISHICACLILCLDMVLAKTLRMSLFTQFDLRSVTLAPKLIRLGAIGYFQTSPRNRDMSELADQMITSWAAPAYDVAIHIRGGDLLKTLHDPNSPYGVLGVEYYRAALQKLPSAQQIHVFTDDLEYAQLICGQIGMALDYTYDNGPLKDMIRGAIAAPVFVASNSTLSYWIVLIREKAVQNIVPKPFQRRRDFDFHNNVDPVNVDYG